jgi:hypothetical protein
MRKFISAISIIVSTLLSLNVAGQSTSSYTYDQLLGQENAISTAVPFLMIAPDSRAGAMGDAGVATSPDGYSQNWNSSKLAFIGSPFGVTISYTPWLKKLVNDINLAYVSGYYRLDENQTFGIGLRYFSMGTINFMKDAETSLGSFSPHEMAVDASYNRKLTDHFSLGLVGRFIYSNLTGGISSSDEVIVPGKSGAIDINGYYTQDMKLMGYKGDWALGFNISNIGAKLGYTEETKNFIPTNLRIGGSGTIYLDDYNSICLTLDLNKLLVPTPPITDATGDTIKYGKDNNVGIIQGMVQSFGDAPDGFNEEMKEINFSFGAEYWYAKQFAVRAGYFYENKMKGNRKYFTAGIGLKMKVLGLDFAYLIPSGNLGNSPLDNTWRFSLYMNFEDIKKQ